MPTTPRIAVITVFHNSEIFFDRYVEALRLQTHPPDLVVLVDSGSANAAYLNRIEGSGLAYLITIQENVGFCRGNNLGYALCGEADYIFFLNPDAFPSPSYLEECVAMLESPDSTAAAVSGALLGFDIATGQPTGSIDSTGIIQTWYGRLIDRDQGKMASEILRYPTVSEVPGLCGAALFCRKSALESVSSGETVFDESFFAYKEDIDLSWRLRSAGWRLLFFPAAKIYHCRGWKQRGAVPKLLKQLSARNEIKLFSKHRSGYIVVALLKYILVRFFGV